MWNTSRIFSSARSSAGEGGSEGVAETIVGALAVTEGGGVMSGSDACDARTSSSSLRAVDDKSARHAVVGGDHAV